MDKGSTICNGGTWSGSQPTVIPAGTATLTIKDVTLHENNYVPVSTVTQLRSLTLSGIVVKNSENKVTRFPFKPFTSNLSLASSGFSSASLPLTSLDLLDIRAYDFGGPSFAKLGSIWIRDCRLTSIDPKTFYSVDTDAPPKSVVLRYFSLVDSDGLTTFNWEVLSPFRETLTSVDISANDNLQSVTYSPSGDPVFKFKQLYNIAFSRNPLLLNVSRSVMDTFVDADLPSHATEYNATFEKNGNRCGTCDLIPLVYWYRTFTGVPRSLVATCVDSDGKEVRLPNSEQAWSDFPIPSQCSTAPFPTRPPPTESRTPLPPGGGGGGQSTTTVKSTGSMNQNHYTYVWLFAVVIVFVLPIYKQNLNVDC